MVYPLASGELEVGGYERRVYGTADRAMLEVVALVLAAGLVMWVGLTWSWGWVGFLGFLLLLGGVGLDLARWERVTMSASYVWFQRGFGRKVHQVDIENIHDVTVSEMDAPGFTLRHLNRNRVCRLNMRMKDKRVVALPQTDGKSSSIRGDLPTNPHLASSWPATAGRERLAAWHQAAAKPTQSGLGRPRMMRASSSAARQRARGPSFPCRQAHQGLNRPGAVQQSRA